MATIRSTCPNCGEVDMMPDKILLVYGERITYKFKCPECQRDVVKPTNQKIVALLEEAGVEWEEEAIYPEKHDGGPPLTIDDLIELHFELEEL